MGFPRAPDRSKKEGSHSSRVLRRDPRSGSRLKQATSTESAPGSQELAPLDSQPLVERIASLAWDKKAVNLRALRVLELVNYTDWFITMSARSDRQVAAIRRHIDDTLRVEDGLHPLSVEGTQQNHWVVIDYGEVVVHIFYEPVRTFYELERLWADAPELDLTPPSDLERPLDPYGDA